jgi:hypothetical protein
MDNFIKNFKFKAWFGDSKVIDENGNPKVVYHGTAKDFDSFDKRQIGKNFRVSELGFYFTNQANTAMYNTGTSASEYAFNSQEKGYSTLDGANVIPAYLRIENPFELYADGWNSCISYVDKHIPQIRRELRENPYKYDGVICRYKDKSESEEELYIVLEPYQIKSAVGNSGEWSDGNNNITESYGVQTDNYYDFYGRIVYITDIIPWSDEYKVEFIHSDKHKDSYIGTMREIEEDFISTSQTFDLGKNSEPAFDARGTQIVKTKIGNSKFQKAKASPDFDARGMRRRKKEDKFYNIVYYVGKKKVETVKWNLPQRLAYALKNQYSRYDKYSIGVLKLEEV